VNSNVLIDCDFTKETIRGTQHLIVKNAKATVNPSRMYIHGTNLLNADKVLGKFAMPV
jgi:hypothetical protein